MTNWSGVWWTWPHCGSGVCSANLARRFKLHRSAELQINSLTAFGSVAGSDLELGVEIFKSYDITWEKPALEEGENSSWICPRATQEGAARDWTNVEKRRARRAQIAAILKKWHHGKQSRRQRRPSWRSDVTANSQSNGGGHLEKVTSRKTVATDCDEDTKDGGSRLRPALRSDDNGSAVTTANTSLTALQPDTAERKYVRNRAGAARRWWPDGYATGLCN